AAHQAGIQELLHVLFRQAFDVHGCARREMYDRAQHLRRTTEMVRAADHDFVADAHQLAVALRAALGKAPRPAAAVARYLYDLRNHVARAMHEHTVARLQTEALDLVGVVQAGVRYRYATDFHRFEHSHGRDGARAADLDFDFLADGFALFRRELD